MQQLLCEAEDRLGSQASSSVSRPDSLVVQARRSGFYAPGNWNTMGDGANLIKVCFVFDSAGWSERFYRLILGSAALTGRTFTDTQLRSGPSFATPRTRGISMTIFRQR